MLKRVIILGVLAGVVASFIFQLVSYPQVRELYSVSYWSNLITVGDVMRMVHTQYVHEKAVEYDQLARASMEGMMRPLDRYSAYMRSRDFQTFEEQNRQSYVGIGIEIFVINSRVTIVTALDDGPAQEAGVVPGDQLVRVDDVNTENFSLNQINELLRGEAETSVRLRVYRPSLAETIDMEIPRRPVALTSVRDVVVSDDGIAYLRINRFGDNTPREFAETLDRLEQVGAHALIMDLRNNPGGLLRAAVGVADVYFDQGEKVVSTRGRTELQNRDYVSRTPERVNNLPLVVLINSGSASEAEIVAGALQDTGRAIIVGERSHGKASVQSLYAIRNGDGIRQTTAMYTMPSGRTIDVVGVVPDVVVPVDGDDYVKLNTQRRHAPYLEKDAFRREFGFDPISDVQRETAESILRSAILVGKFREVRAI